MSRPLTTRQQEAAKLLALGLSNKEIARRMGLAEGTVKTHVAQVLRYLNVPTRARAIVAILNAS